MLLLMTTIKMMAIQQGGQNTMGPTMKGHLPTLVSPVQPQSTAQLPGWPVPG
jgi:hypothetical protein